MNQVTVVVLAAGLGTRMRSKQAKVLHRAGGQALVEHVLDAAGAIAPASDTLVVVGHQAERVKALLAPRGVAFIHQTEQLGTGHALLCGREQLEGAGGLLVVLNGDSPLIRAATLSGLVERHLASGAAATMLTTDLDDPHGYGRIVRGASGDVREIVEQKSATEEQKAIREINAGQYCFDAALFWHHIDQLKNDNAAGEYYLTDMIAVLIGAGHRVEGMKLADAAELMGINNRVELAQVDRIFRDRKTRELMLEGVTIEKPETVTIDAWVTVGMDSVIEPFAQLFGRTKVGEGCRVGACSILRDAELSAGAEVAPFTMVNDSRVGEGATVGPYARLRLGNTVGARAHIGNFVELKNAVLAEGVKAGHLAYLGDCAIGARTNIGAGSITCNYDGARKHHTEIGSDAFIGSNATLVAPLDVGDGAYTAAGSVITENVPAKALALGRARQVVKEGWTRR